MSDVIKAIGSALQSTGAIIHAVPDGGWQRPTPCSDWTVRDVTNHLVGGLCIFTDQLGGLPGRADHDSDWLADDPVACYDTAATDDTAAWARPDALDGSITIGLGVLPSPLAAVIHLTEVLVHGADVAVAIGREDLIDQDACAALLAAMQQMGGVDPFRMPGVFGPAVPIPGSEVPHRQLLGYLGRTVTSDGPVHVA